MAEDELADLKSSIADHGLRHSIVLLDGQVLDGRNRQDACFAVDVPPMYRDFDPALDGDLPVSFVTDENLNRRNLTPGQRAAIGAELEPFFAKAMEERKKAKAKAQAAARKKSEEAAAQDRQDRQDAVKDAFDAMKGIHGDDKSKSFLGGALAAYQGTDEGKNPHEDAKKAEDWKAGHAAQLDHEAAEVKKASAEPTSAAEAAAKAAGSSATSVKEAKKLKGEDPDEFEKVKAGEKSLNAGKEDAQAAAEAVDPYRAECAEMMEGSHGEDIAEGVRNSTLLKTKAELEAFMDVGITDQKALLPYLAKAWKVADALSFIHGKFDGQTSAATLINFANMNGGTAEVKIDGHVLIIKPIA